MTCVDGVPDGLEVEGYGYDDELESWYVDFDDGKDEMTCKLIAMRAEGIYNAIRYEP